MNLFAQEKATRREWRLAVLATTLASLLVLLLNLSACTRKKNNTSAAPVPVDTLRQGLQRQLDAKKQQLNTTQGNARNTVTDYEAALSQYNSQTVTLP